MRLDRLAELTAQLTGIVRTDARLMAALALCRDLLPVTAWIGAGAIRNTVWDHLHGRTPGPLADIDVVFHDAALPPHADAGFAAMLHASCPDLAWDVTNQAHVHRWYGDHGGNDVAPFGSLAEGIASWPDTATAVAVRLAADGSIDVLAPFGLDDLFGLVVRWNPARVSADVFLARIHAKQWLGRWPRLSIADCIANSVAN
jgi:hypothetical protein